MAKAAKKTEAPEFKGEQVIPHAPPAHTVLKGNPQIDGPYLDDIREAQMQARRDANDAVAKLQKEKVEKQQKELEESSK